MKRFFQILLIVTLLSTFYLFSDSDSDEYLKIENKIDKIENILSEGDSLYKNRMIEEYIASLKTALKLSQEERRKDYEIKVVFRLAAIYQNAALPSLSLELLEKYKNMIFKDGKKENLFFYYRRMGFLSYYAFNQVDKGLDYFKKLLDLSLSLNDFNKICLSYYYISMIYRDKADYDSALENLGKAEAYYNEGNKMISYGAIMNNLGDLYELKKDYDKAYEYYYKSYEDYIKNDNFYGLIVNYTNLASIHKYRKEYNKALDYQLKSLKLAEKYKVQNSILDNYVMLHGIYSALDSFDIALEYYNKYSLFDKILLIPNIADVVNRIENKYDLEKKMNENEILNLKLGKEKMLRNALILTFLILFLVFYLAFYKKLQIRRIQELRLKEEKIKAELSSLQSKMNPHFLFNSLNSISTLILKSPAAAEKMIEHLSLLLRYTLRNSQQNFVTLQEELNIVEKYLEIEKIRFQERLNYKIDFDNDLANVTIPPLTIQPLVENSIKHGIANLIEGGLIEIKCSRVSKNLMVISVFDNGNGVSGKLENAKSGIGLKNIQERLKIIYGDDFEFEILSSNGFKVNIYIPLK